MKIHYFGGSRRSGKTTWLINKMKSFASDDYTKEYNFLFVVLNESLKASLKRQLLYDHEFVKSYDNMSFVFHYKNVNVRIVNINSTAWKYGTHHDKAFFDNIEYMPENIVYNVFPYISDEIYTTQSGESERDYFKEEFE